MTQEEATLDGVSGLSNRRLSTLRTVAIVVLTITVYYPILRNMIYHWRVVPDYSHGFLIVPLALYFAYQKKYEIAAARLEGSWWGIAPMALGLLLLGIGQLGSLLTSLRSGFVLTLMGIVLLLLGREIFRILLFPLAFLLLMIPLPQSFVNIVAFPLQLIAAGWAVASLHWLAIPALLEGNIIHLAHTDLFVAEACSGLRSLMALLTLGVVFAHFFRPGRRLEQLFLVASTLPIAIFVNAMRVALTAVLAHAYGQQATGGFIHEFQGMITFSVAFLLLLAEAGLMQRLIPRRAALTDDRGGEA